MKKIYIITLLLSFIVSTSTQMVAAKEQPSLSNLIKNALVSIKNITGRALKHTDRTIKKNPGKTFFGLFFANMFARHVVPPTINVTKNIAKNIKDRIVTAPSAIRTGTISFALSSLLSKFGLPVKSVFPGLWGALNSMEQGKNAHLTTTPPPLNRTDEKAKELFEKISNNLTADEKKSLKNFIDDIKSGKQSSLIITGNGFTKDTEPDQIELLKDINELLNEIGCTTSKIDDPSVFNDTFTKENAIPNKIKSSGKAVLIASGAEPKAIEYLTKFAQDNGAWSIVRATNDREYEKNINKKPNCHVLKKELPSSYRIKEICEKVFDKYESTKNKSLATCFYKYLDGFSENEVTKITEKCAQKYQKQVKNKYADNTYFFAKIIENALKEKIDHQSANKIDSQAKIAHLAGTDVHEVFEPSVSKIDNSCKKFTEALSKLRNEQQKLISRAVLKYCNEKNLSEKLTDFPKEQKENIILPGNNRDWNLISLENYVRLLLNASKTCEPSSDHKIPAKKEDTCQNLFNRILTNTACIIGNASRALDPFSWWQKPENHTKDDIIKDKLTTQAFDYYQKIYPFFSDCYKGRKIAAAISKKAGLVTDETDQKKIMSSITTGLTKPLSLTSSIKPYDPFFSETDKQEQIRLFEEFRKKYASESFNGMLQKKIPSKDDIALISKPSFQKMVNDSGSLLPEDLKDLKKYFDKISENSKNFGVIKKTIKQKDLLPPCMDFFDPGAFKHINKIERKNLLPPRINTQDDFFAPGALKHTNKRFNDKKWSENWDNTYGKKYGKQLDEKNNKSSDFPKLNLKKNQTSLVLIEEEDKKKISDTN